MVHPTVVGIFIAIFANVSVNVGLNLQKYAHMQVQESDESRSERASTGPLQIGGVFKNKIWILGLITQLGGEAGNMAAYSFAATSIVAPLGAVGLLTNLLISTSVLGEEFRGRDVVGALGCASGASLIAINAPTNELRMSQYDILYNVIGTANFWMFYIAVTMSGVAVWLMHRRNMIRNVGAPLGVSVTFASYTLLSVKSVSLMIQETVAGDSQLKFGLFWIMILFLAISGPGQVYWLNQALGQFNASLVVPSYYVCFSITAISVGGIVFRDFRDMSTTSTLFFAFGALISIVGVLIINSKRAEGCESTATSMKMVKNPTFKNDADISVPLIDPKCDI